MKKYFNSQDARNLVNEFDFSIFPIHGIKEDGSCTCNKQSCAQTGKHPATPDGFKSASKNIDQIKRIWAGRKGLNVGIATGKPSGIFVIDIDDPEAEKAFYSKFNVPNTYTVTTGRGKHLYFQYDENTPVNNSANIIKGVDVRGDGGYVIGAGSHHKNGACYQVLNPLEEIAKCPKDILGFITQKKEVSLIETTPKLYQNTSEGWTIEQVQEHLDHINPDCGYDEWVKVGMALHAEGLPFHLFDNWSRRGVKYDGSTKDHWKSFSVSGGVTYGTVVAYAKAGGWRYNGKQSAAPAAPIKESFDPETGEIIEQNARKLPLLFASDIKPSLETNDFVEDLLCANQFSVIYGESNCGKTFFMLDLAMHVALGRKWRDKEVDGGAVLYAALEGGHGTKNRIAAFKNHYQITQDINLAIIPSSINFLDAEGDIQSLLNAIKEAQERIGDIKLIVIDTLARAISGGDENSSQDMGQMIIHADMIREITGAHISFIHHSGKDSVKGARGHSSLRAAVDTEIEISRPDETSPSAIKVVKQREMEMIETMAFKLQRVELGINARNKEISSCVVIPAEAQDVKKEFIMNPTQQFIYDSLVDTIIKRGEKRVVYHGLPAISCVSYDQLRETMEERGFKEIMETEKKTTAQQIKSATQSARLALKKHGKINFNSKHVWLVENSKV